MAFIAIVHIAGTTPPDGIMSDDLRWPDGTRLVGVFVYPEKKDIGCLPMKHDGGWTRDKRGWMKCASCGQRNKDIRRFVIRSLFDFLGANLYPEAPSAFRTPEGYGISPR